MRRERPHGQARYHKVAAARVDGGQAQAGCAVRAYGIGERERAVGRIEVHGGDMIAEIRDVLQEGKRVGEAQFFGAAEVDAVAVGCPHGKRNLIAGVVVGQGTGVARGGQQPVAGYVIDQQPAQHVGNQVLRLVKVGMWKYLYAGRRKRDEPLGGMPGGVGQPQVREAVRQVYFAEAALTVQQRAAVLAAQVDAHAGRVVLCRGVAVEALAARAPVVHQQAFFKVLQTAFFGLQVFAGVLIVGAETVNQIGVDGVQRHRPPEHGRVSKRLPLPVKEAEAHMAARRLLQALTAYAEKMMPLFLGGIKEME